MPLAYLIDTVGGISAAICVVSLSAKPAGSAAIGSIANETISVAPSMLMVATRKSKSGNMS